jgi:hypothetical protein
MCAESLPRSLLRSLSKKHALSFHVPYAILLIADLFGHGDDNVEGFRRVVRPQCRRQSRNRSIFQWKDSQVPSPALHCRHSHAFTQRHRRPLQINRAGFNPSMVMLPRRRYLQPIFAKLANLSLISLLCFRISTEDVRHNTPLHFHIKPWYGRFVCDKMLSLV